MPNWHIPSEKSPDRVHLRLTETCQTELINVNGSTSVDDASRTTAGLMD